MYHFLQQVVIIYITVVVFLFVVMTDRHQLQNNNSILIDVASNARVNMVCRNGFVFAISDSGSILQVMDDALIPRYMTCHSKHVEPKH